MAHIFMGTKITINQTTDNNKDLIVSLHSPAEENPASRWMAIIVESNPNI
jgi:hypothetical protein